MSRQNPKDPSGLVWKVGVPIVAAALTLARPAFVNWIVVCVAVFFSGLSVAQRTRQRIRQTSAQKGTPSSMDSAT